MDIDRSDIRSAAAAMAEDVEGRFHRLMDTPLAGIRRMAWRAWRRWKQEHDCERDTPWRYHFRRWLKRFDGRTRAWELVAAAMRREVRNRLWTLKDLRELFEIAEGAIGQRPRVSPPEHVRPLAHQRPLFSEIA